MPKRPVHSMKSVMANLHVLTGVASFARWPLNVHFLAREAYSAWESRIRSAQQQYHSGVKILTDFNEPMTTDAGEATSAANGIHALPLDYQSMSKYVEKAHDVVHFEQEGNCVHCAEELESGKGLHAMCPNDECKAMGHLDCWSSLALSKNSSDHIIPEECTCPSCGGQVRWGDMVKELSLRIRGASEVKKLLKRAQKGKAVAK